MLIEVPSVPFIATFLFSYLAVFDSYSSMNFTLHCFGASTTSVKLCVI